MEDSTKKRARHSANLPTPIKKPATAALESAEIQTTVLTKEKGVVPETEPRTLPPEEFCFAEAARINESYRCDFQKHLSRGGCESPFNHMYQRFLLATQATRGKKDMCISESASLVRPFKPVVSLGMPPKLVEVTMCPTCRGPGGVASQWNWRP